MHKHDSIGEYPEQVRTILCGGCHQPKLEADYYPSDLRTGNRRCKTCRNEAQRARWQACKELVDQLKAVPCPDCGIEWPPMCMEFDHRDPAEKDERISAIVASGSMRRLRAELAKGEFVCANCHRIRTSNFAWRLGFEGRAKAGQWLEHLAQKAGAA